MLNINQEIQQGRYRIIKQFGQGKTNSFYEVYDKTLAKNVLLKKISVKMNEAANSAQVEKQNNAFADEAKFLSEIKHDGFLQVIDYFFEGDARYLVLEAVDGKNVGELIKNSSKLVSPANVLDWGKQTLDALDYLHKKTPPIVYFNLKPSNLFLTSDENIKLLATGIADRSDSNGEIKKQEFDSANLNYSPLEVIWEKLDTASQRVILNGFDENSEELLIKQPGARSDIYSLGATLYHLLTGKLPVNALERSIELLENKPDPLFAPNEVNPNIAAELSDVLMKALEIKRENRFETALEMRDELENVYALLRERKILELSKKTRVASAVPVVKTNPASQKTENLYYETSQIRAAESDQLELIKQKLQEAEAQRLLAEQRAAEAERRLIAMGKQESKEDDILELSELPEFSNRLAESLNTIKKENVRLEEVAETTNVDEVLTEEKISGNLQSDSSEEFDNLFAQPQKDNTFMKRMAVAAGVIIILGGAIWGVMTFLPTASDAPNQETANQMIPAVEIPAEKPPPIAETTPDIATETSSELDETQEIKQNPAVTPENPVAVKQKTPVPQIATAKQPETRKSVETGAKKKKVTVDDLINDTPQKKKKVTVDDLIDN